MNPACGPPKPSGTPNRWAEPTTTSAPHSPGAGSRVSASRSAATATTAPRSLAAAATADQSRTSPDAPGYCSSSPAISPSGSPSAATSRTSIGMPIGFARVRITAMVCGRQSASSTTGAVGAVRDTRRASATASAAAVASSSRLAFAVGSPDRSATTVWKFSSASSRPCAISGWYGVYAVYQDGFSMMFRRITGGVIVSL